MLGRGITLSVAALLALGPLAQTASADHHKRPRGVYTEEEYRGPAFIRQVPGLRIFFGDYALSEEEFDELYGTGRQAYENDDDYDEPAPPPRRRVIEKTPQKPKPPKAVTAKQPEAKKASASTALSCDKATSVVSGYGFSSVTPSIMPPTTLA